MRLACLLTLACLACSVHAHKQAPSVDRIVDYGLQVRAKLQPYLWHVPSAKPDAAVEVLVTMDDAGYVQSAQIRHSSGSAMLDAMAVAAFQRASPLPLDKGKAVPHISWVISNPAP